mgnify:CR=1 FL=1
MAIFEHKHFGSTISQKLATYIIYNQRKGDIEEMANKHSFSSHTLTNVLNIHFSKNTINELIQKAI